MAVDGLGLDVAAGQVHALVGLNGAGKSTLMRLLVGLLRPDAGTRRAVGRAGVAGTGSRPGPHRLRRRRTQLRRAHRHRTPDLVGSPARVPAQDAKRRAGDQIDRLALGRWASKPTRTLSSGNRQRLAVASALVHDPDLLILDEPTNALDPAGVIELRRIIADRAAAGAAVFVSSHHLDEMARLASTISVMHDGRIVGTLPPDGVDLERQFFRTVEAAASRGSR